MIWTLEKHLIVSSDRLGQRSPGKDCCQWLWQKFAWQPVWKSSSEVKDDFHSGYRNISHIYQLQSFSGLLPFRQSHHMNVPSNSSWVKRFQCCLSLSSKALTLSFKTQNYPQGTNDGSSIDVIHCSIWRLVREGLEGGGLQVSHHWQCFCTQPSLKFWIYLGVVFNTKPPTN